MAFVRALEERDLPEVVRLFRQVHPEEGADPPAERERYFREIFLANPWVDPALPSWVAHEGLRIVGFIGVMPRAMRYKTKTLRAAVVSQLMVAPEKRHGLAAAQLLRKVLSGPQALTISDGANEVSRRMWEALGGTTSALYSLEWRRLLRPARYALEAARQRGRGPGRLGAPVAAIVDAYAAQRLRLRRDPGLAEQPLDAASLLKAMQRAFARASLAPVYEPATLEWLLAQARAKRRHGELQGRLLFEPGGELAGWFLYYLNARMSRVLQLWAREGREQTVVDQLFVHAWRRGAAAIEGRMDPRFARTLTERHCYFVGAGAYALVHAPHPALLSTLERGQAFFSRLEGEWWMRFTGEPHAEESPGSALAELIARLRLAAMRTRAQPAIP